MDESNTLLKGSLNDAILTLLSSRGSMYGYEICQHVKDLTSGQMGVTEGALYPALHKMEGEALLVSHSEIVEGRPRKYYAIAQDQKKYAVNPISRIQDFITQLQILLNPSTFSDLKFN